MIDYTDLLIFIVLFSSLLILFNYTIQRTFHENDFKIQSYIIKSYENMKLKKRLSFSLFSYVVIVPKYVLKMGNRSVKRVSNSTIIKFPEVCFYFPLYKI